MPLKFREISNDDSEIVWISPEVDYGDYPLRYQIVLEYTDHWGNDGPKGAYHVSIVVTSLVAAANALVGLRESFGMTSEDFAEIPDEHKHSMLRQAAKATLFQMMGNNKRKLLQQARQEMKSIEMLFGFYMDKPQNAIGSTGWDFIGGDILAGVYRERAGA